MSIGHTCEEAEDGQVAVKKVKERLNGTKNDAYPMFDVVLMDFGNTSFKPISSYSSLILQPETYADPSLFSSFMTNTINTHSF